MENKSFDFRRITLVISLMVILLLYGCDKDDNNIDSIFYGSVIDEKDNKKYKTIKIGNVQWLAEDYAYMDSFNYNNDTLNTGGGHYDKSQALAYALPDWELPGYKDWQDLLKSDAISYLDLTFVEDLILRFHEAYWVNQSYLCCDYPDSLLKDGEANINVYCRWNADCDNVLGVELYKNFEKLLKFGLNKRTDKCKVRYIKKSNQPQAL